MDPKQKQAKPRKFRPKVGSSEPRPTTTKRPQTSRPQPRKSNPNTPFPSPTMPTPNPTMPTPNPTTPVPNVPFSNPQYYPIMPTHPNMPFQTEPGQFTLGTGDPRIPFDPYAYREPNRNPKDFSPIGRGGPSQPVNNSPPPYDDVPDSDDSEFEPVDLDSEHDELHLSGKGKEKCAFPNRAPRTEWTGEDEGFLAKAFYHISTDKKVGDYQTGNNLWHRVTKEYHKHQTNHTRNFHQISSKWRKMDTKIKKFNAIYHQLLHNWGSGKSWENIFQETQHRYEKQYGHKFKHVEAWHVVKDYDKYKYVEPIDGEATDHSSSKRSKTSRESTPYSAGFTSPSRIPDLNEETTPKESFRRKSKTVDGTNPDRLAEAIEKYRITKETEIEERREAKELRKRREELELQMLEDQRQERQQRRMERDLKSFTAPHDHLHGKVLESFLQMKREIAIRWGWDFDE